MVKTINVTELQKLLKNNKNAVFIDVREPAENAAECIDGTCLIPLNQISVAKLPSKSGPIIVHCGSGIRSAKACEKLLAEDPSLEVYSLEGGIAAWKRQGCSVQCNSTAISINRQVQITSGTLTLTGVILGALINPWFYLLAGIIGAGLLYSGISGSCSMAVLLEKMPWNKIN